MAVIRIDTFPQLKDPKWLSVDKGLYHNYENINGNHSKSGCKIFLKTTMVKIYGIGNH